MPDIFISYKREDRGRAREIADGIERHGFSVFFDVEIDVGESFDERIEREIADAKCVVVLWSERSCNARWVKREARFGATHDRLAPAIIGDCKIPLEFSDVQAANLQAWRGDPADADWRQFIERITECTQQPAIALSPKPWRRRWVRIALGGVAAALLVGGGVAAWREYGPRVVAQAPSIVQPTTAEAPAPRVPSPEAQDFLAAEVRGYFPEAGAQMTPEMCGFARDWVASTRARYADWQYVQDVAERLRRRCAAADIAPTPAASQSAPAQPRPETPRPEQAQQPAAAEAGFIASLRAGAGAELSSDDIREVAAEFGVPAAALQAVVTVESGRGGFGADGRPIILFEPHIFSRMTNRRFDDSHPNVSFPAWDRTRYPREQTGRYAQLAEAYALDPEAALSATSWGRFQIMGLNFARTDFANAADFVRYMARSERNQLIATMRFVRSTGLIDEMQTGDWEGFARGYNGPGQVERYGRLLREAAAAAAP